MSVAGLVVVVIGMLRLSCLSSVKLIEQTGNR